MQGPRLYRFFNYEKIFYLPAPVGGWNPDVNPWQLPLNQAQQLDNFLIRPDKIINRGPFVVSKDLSAYYPVAPITCIVGPAANGVPAEPWYLIPRLHSNSGVEFIANWDAPGMRVTGSTSLMRGTGTGIFYNVASATLSTPTLQPSPGPRWINFDGLLYGIAFDDLPSNTTANDANATYTVWATKLLTMPLVNSSAPTITSNPQAPQGAFDLISYQSRIWLLGGVDVPGGGSTHSATTIFFTNPGASGVGTVTADWKDPVYGTTNKIVLDQDNSDYGVGFAVVRNGLLIFRRHSVWLLRGTTTANYTLIPLSREIGAVDARGIVETDQGAYFLSDRGLYLCDGVRVVDMSGTMKHTLSSVIQLEQSLRGVEFGSSTGVWSGTGYDCMQLTASGDLMITIGGAPGNGPSTQLLRTRPVLSLLYSRTYKAWVRVTSGLWGLENYYQNTQNPVGPMLATNLTGSPFIVSAGDKFLTICDTLSGSLSEPVANSNNSTTASCPFDLNGTNGYPIPLSWTSRAVPIIGNSTRNRNYGQAKRFFMDYVSAYGGQTGLLSGGYTVMAVDLTNNRAQLANTPTYQTALDSLNILKGWTGFGYFDTPDTLISHINEDFWTELTDIAFNVSLQASNQTGVSDADMIGEIHGLGIEFQGAREAR